MCKLGRVQHKGCLLRLRRQSAHSRVHWLRRRLELGPEQRDFPALADFYAAGATDYLCLAFRVGEAGDRSHETGVLYSFTTDRPGGFRAAEIDLLRSTLPGLSLAMKAHTGHDIASGLLRTYLGSDAGSRVHSGAVEEKHRDCRWGRLRAGAAHARVLVARRARA
jgi:hypothetical protein